LSEIREATGRQSVEEADMSGKNGGKAKNDPRQLKLDFRVRLEPVLQETVAGLTLAEVLDLAKAHYRWGKQLFVLFDVMRADGVSLLPGPALRLPPCVHPERN
jgi:hypothetical protein